jgi:ElaB/YqjD/DUF883 family membrane-anchored ribosome-binding protein
MEEAITTENAVTMDRLVKDFKVVVNDAERLIRATAGDLGEKARDARQRLSVSLDSAKANAHKLEDRARESARATDLVIRDHPYESIGVAFCGGLILGVLLAR